MPWQTCNALIQAQKLGDAIGVYDASMLVIGVITDLSISIGNKQY